jgi:hypothetical protein
MSLEWLVQSPAIKLTCVRKRSPQYTAVAEYYVVVILFARDLETHWDNLSSAKGRSNSLFATVVS